ncbi:hypothetical protein L6452_19594 [Arctium lappa]|uniref:Uncharacterized protein n=1 Tax=Arctium lappa TaxID=4217 RepID=A0ACB9B8H6_ARCLA|nr:hypothetical protein L6452_19594 [Arctium lappa]
MNDVKPGYVASNYNDDPAKDVANFTAHVIIMNHPGQSGNGSLALKYCTSHIAIKFAEPSTEGRMIRTKPMVVETFAEYLLWDVLLRGICVKLSLWCD